MPLDSTIFFYPMPELILNTNPDRQCLKFRPSHAAMFSINEDSIAIHSAPDFWGERFALRVSLTIPLPFES
jgi:hypothetical protein